MSRLPCCGLTQHQLNVVWSGLITGNCAYCMLCYLPMGVLCVQFEYHIIMNTSWYLLTVQCMCLTVLRERPVRVVGSHSVLGRCVPWCCSTGTRHHWHGPGTNWNDGEVSGDVVWYIVSCTNPSSFLSFWSNVKDWRHTIKRCQRYQTDVDIKITRHRCAVEVFNTLEAWETIGKGSQVTSVKLNNASRASTTTTFLSQLIDYCMSCQSE